MPLVKRTVEPIYIGRAPLDKNVKNELEGVVVNSLAGVIKQLSSISKHAENLFGDLISEANSIFQRSASLNQRVEMLYQKTSRLDSTSREEVKVEEFSFQNHFKSSRKEDQQMLDRSTLPVALQEVYTKCEPPPNLNEFTPYRDDKKKGLKFYTDPNYFYDLWVQSQQQLIEKKKKKGKKHRKRKANKPGKAIKEVTKRKYQGVDKEFQDREHSRAPPPPPDQAQQPAAVQVGEKQQYVPEPPGPAGNSSPYPSPGPQLKQPHAPPPVAEPSYAQENRPGMAPPPPPPPGVSVAQYSAPMAPPPPPPPATVMGGPVPPPPPPPGPDFGGPPQVMSNSPQVPHYPMGAPPPPPPPAPGPAAYAAPAPPPPPMPSVPGAPPPPMPPAMPGGPAPPPPPAAAPAPAPAKPVEDSRSALLAAIEMGKKLRKVEKNDAVKQREYGSDVASILSRRIHIELSDTDSDSEGSDSSDGEWED